MDFLQSINIICRVSSNKSDNTYLVYTLKKEELQYEKTVYFSKIIKDEKGKEDYFELSDAELEDAKEIFQEIKKYYFK